MSLLSRLIPDRFIWALIATILIASLLPVRGEDVATANFAAGGAVFVIFLLHGIRLPRAEIFAGMRNWRVQGGLSLFIFGVMPLTGLALARILDGWLPAFIAIGFLYAGTLPTTVQSATSYCSIARGNVAVSIVASALNNLAAVLATPLLFAALAGQSGGVTLSSDLALRIALILLLPFFVGQMLQSRLRPFVMRFPSATRLIDQGAILIAVYVAFSAAVVDGIWTILSAGDFALLAAAVGVMLLIGFGGAWWMGRLLRAPHDDRTAILFSGAHKSIAVGAPLAALLFPAHAAGMVLLPVLLYHMAQLVISAWIAPVLARGEEARIIA